ncbi:MAG: hypothetical protein A3H76_02090 [Candidatus Lloydbacteria bacterium RIFCSPLOWO2_02_FULL_54_12]|nr:MAG: hypothetical protein A3H76_02090 [Candidatus Lloydbacteria bacterium RIFCSPLOWO2_02_FULL_54_12]
MSKIAEQIEKISQSLSEPTWLLSWRNDKARSAETLPKTLKYGIGILGVLPEGEVSFAQIADYHVDASKGLELHTWKEAVAQEEIASIVEGLLKSEFFPNATDHYGGLGQAVFRSGLVVYAPPSMGEDGVLKEEKLMLDTMVPEGASADLIVVIAKEGARLSLTSALSGGSTSSVFARTLVVLTESDAHVRVTQKQSLHKGTTALFSARGVVAAHSSVLWREVVTGEIRTRSETVNVLVGESARGDIAQGIVACGDARYDVLSSAEHLADHTHSRIRAAGISRDTSKTVYRGMIDMVEGVRAVLGGQEARFLVLSPKAEVDAIPSLDIASKEVQCTHRLSISHIRDTDIFYPKLRGLSDEESRRLFLEGHFAQVFPGEENEEVMINIREELNKKFA